jgi:hypothetical protein
MGCMKESMDMLVYRTSFYMVPLMSSSKWHAITSLSLKGEGDTHTCYTMWIQRHNSSNITINWPNYILIIIVRERERARILKPGYNQVIAVKIFKEKITVMKVITAKKPWSIRDYCCYINTVLMNTIERGTTSSSSHTSASLSKVG